MKIKFVFRQVYQKSESGGRVWEVKEFETFEERTCGRGYLLSSNYDKIRRQEHRILNAVQVHQQKPF